MLVFVGVKMLVADIYKVPVGVSLAVIVLVLAASVAASWLWPRHSLHAQAAAPDQARTIPQNSSVSNQ